MRETEPVIKKNATEGWTTVLIDVGACSFIPLLVTCVCQWVHVKILVTLILCIVFMQTGWE